MNQESQPLVSVVIACYNHAAFVQSCIQSVIEQTYQNIELIIIDDGSQDISVEKIQKMVLACEKRFTRFEFRYRPNKGLTATLNEALLWCKGQYYCPFASDDMMIKNRISLQLKYMENHENCAGVFGGYEIIDEDGVVINLRKKSSKRYIFNDIFLHNHELPAPTQLLRMNIIKEIGGYASDILIEDWYMWLKITELGYTLDYINVEFVQYRRHDNNMSNRYDKMQDARLQVLQFFSSNPNYVQALANSYLVASNDWLKNDKKKSMVYFRKSIQIDPKIFTDKKRIKKIIKYIIKYLVV